MPIRLSMMMVMLMVMVLMMVVSKDEKTIFDDILTLEVIITTERAEVWF